MRSTRRQFFGTILIAAGIGKIPSPRQPFTYRQDAEMAIAKLTSLKLWGKLKPLGIPKGRITQQLYRFDS